MMPAVSIRLMEALLASGPQGAHRESLISQTQMSTATFYRALEPLLKTSVLRDEGGHYTLPLSHAFNFAFKLWHDQERLLALPGPVRDEVTDLIEKIQAESGTNLLGLWLHGSVAQKTMHSESDVDFLLVLRRKQKIELKGSRSIQLTCLTDKSFKEMYRDGDNFVRTVLAYGLLLVDHRFAQEFYAKPFPSADRRAHQDQESLQERARSRMFFFIRNEELNDARAALSSLAVVTSRAILEQLGELPAGKDDLVESLLRHFGPESSGLVQTCLAKQSTKDDLFRLQDKLSTWQSRFSVHAAHLKKLLAGFYGPPQQFEHVCKDLLSSLFPQIKEPLSSRADLWCDTADGPIAIQCKSMTGKFGSKQLHSGHNPGAVGTARLMVVNHMREVPLLLRSALSTAVREEAEHLGVTLWDSRDLWREHNSFIISGTPTSPSPGELARRYSEGASVEASLPTVRRSAE